MKHFLLKFNHGVEIGARLAYLGHFARTGEAGIHKIILDEAEHRHMIEFCLRQIGEKPSPVIDFIFTQIGSLINWSCKYCPLWSLDLVARSMEMFAIFNYTYLAVKYPKGTTMFIEMAKTERRHAEYFKRIA